MQHALAGFIIALAAAAPPSFAATIVQSGSLNGGAGSQTQNVLVNQFDSMGGTRQLDSVQLDFLTSVIGGYQTNGSGVAVQIFAQLDADWFYLGSQVGDTQALISTTVANNSSGAATVFNTDTDQMIFTQPSDLASWIGTGQNTLTAMTAFQISQTPPGVIGFSAGGTVKYTLTYGYTVVPGPSGLAALGLAAAASRKRRRAPC